MTIFYRVEPESLVTFVTCTGTVTYDDVMAAMDACLSDVDATRPQWVLADLSELRQVDISFREMLALIAALAKRFKEVRAADPHIALFAPTKTTRGMGKLFQMLAGTASGLQITLHDSYADTAAAIGLPGMVATPAHARTPRP